MISVRRVVLMAVCLFAATAAPASATYYPTGPQANVNAGQLDGWTLCFSGLYGDNFPAVSQVLSQCPGGLLMLAGGPTGSSTLTVLAAAPRADVLFDEAETNNTHAANGTGWYFSDSYSWGFAKQGDPVDRDSCDVEASNDGNPNGPNPDLRLCWHTVAGSLDGGYRAGAVIDLNSSTDYTRYVYEANCDAGVKFGTVRRNRKKGTATLPVTVSFPGTLTGSGKGLKLVQSTAAGAGTVDLPVKPKGAKRRALNEDGKAKVTDNVSFAASCGKTGGSASKVKLRKKLG